MSKAPKNLPEFVDFIKNPTCDEFDWNFSYGSDTVFDRRNGYIYEYGETPLTYDILTIGHVETTKNHPEIKNYCEMENLKDFAGHFYFNEALTFFGSREAYRKPNVVIFDSSIYKIDIDQIEIELEEIYIKEASIHPFTKHIEKIIFKSDTTSINFLENIKSLEESNIDQLDIRLPRDDEFLNSFNFVRERVDENSPLINSMFTKYFRCPKFRTFRIFSDNEEIKKCKIIRN